MRKPFAAWLLVFFMLFLGLGGLYGGASMLADPSGRLLQMDTVLPALHVPNYVLPGLFLTGVMGLLPILLAYGLVGRASPNWAFLQSLSRWNGQHWAWTGSVALGILLAFWLALQGALIGFRWPVQFVTIFNAVMILGLSFLPQVKRCYALDRANV